VVDSAERRNKIAAIVCRYYINNSIDTVNASRTVQIGLDMRLVAASQMVVLAALNGETRPSAMGIDSMSVPAMTIADLCREDT
jgi:hypothetical protein